MVQVPWWGIASSVLAPIVLIGGWTAGADLQPVPFDAVARSISTLAAQGMPYRWVVTLAILGVGACDIVTGVALRAAADTGRILLIFGGVCGMLIAANPQPHHGGSLAHEGFATLGVLVMTVWPVAAIRRHPDAPAGLRPRPAWTIALINLATLLWFTAELFNGPMLGLAERTVTAEQAIWPLVVVLTVTANQLRPAAPAAAEETVSRQ